MKKKQKALEKSLIRLTRKILEYKTQCNVSQGAVVGVAHSLDIQISNFCQRFIETMKAMNLDKITDEVAIRSCREFDEKNQDNRDVT
jgi:hypothetical protein